jgi:hypothetical protein
MRSQRNGSERSRRGGNDAEKAHARKRNGVSAAQRRHKAELDVPDELEEIDDDETLRLSEQEEIADDLDGDDVLEH